MTRTERVIPKEALDDRLGWVGTSGSGKTYNAGESVEKLLGDGARVVIVDPLGVWWGLRLMADGKTPSPYRVVIFGGSHADLPVNEHAGALIGETVAGMAESCIIALDGLGTKAAERRFMLAFLETLYRKATGEPLHVIFDEADLWAPQKSLEPMLQNLMEQIVRRGRVKGFIPWLITQRPAVISKDVLSQVDGLVAFKLTSSQDRDALQGWVEGQADREEWKAIRAQLPTMERGMGVVWIPGRGVLETKSFPAKSTFDSSATPKRGEKKRKAAELEPLDLPALKERLAKVEAETKANDPKALRAENAKLRAELRQKEHSFQAEPDPKAIEAAEKRGYGLGRTHAWAEALRAFEPIVDRAQTLKRDLASHVDGMQVSLGAWREHAAREHTNAPAPAVPKMYAKPLSRRVELPVLVGLTRPQQRLLDALAGLESIGIRQPSRNQLALWAEVSPTSGGYFNSLGALRSAGLVEYPSGGSVALTDAGRQVANHRPPPSVEEVQLALCERVGPAKAAIVRTLVETYPEALARDELANRIGVSPTSGGYFNNLGALRTMGVIDYPLPGFVAAQKVLFLEQ